MTECNPTGAIPPAQGCRTPVMVRLKGRQVGTFQTFGGGWSELIILRRRQNGLQLQPHKLWYFCALREVLQRTCAIFLHLLELQWRNIHQFCALREVLQRTCAIFCTLGLTDHRVSSNGGSFSNRTGCGILCLAWSFATHWCNFLHLWTDWPQRQQWRITHQFQTTPRCGILCLAWSFATHLCNFCTFGLTTVSMEDQKKDCQFMVFFVPCVNVCNALVQIFFALLNWPQSQNSWGKIMGFEVHTEMCDFVWWCFRKHGKCLW